MSASYVPHELLDFIRDGRKFLIAGHREPDGDCVGSQLALRSALRRMGKEAEVYSAGPFKRTEIRQYSAEFHAAATAEERKGARLIILDCSMPSRLGDLEESVRGLPCATIDHHAAGQPSGDVRFIDPNAPSVTFMIRELIEALGLESDPVESELLLFGLCTDTGFFRHLDVGTERVFVSAGKLVAAGASPKRIFSAMYGGKSLDSRFLLGLILSRVRSYYDGKLLVSHETLEDTERFGLEGRDSDSLYQLLQSVDGVEAIVILRQETPDNCTVGFRSRDRVDVSRIAAQFGGGGHRQASGLSHPGLVAELEQRIVAAFAPDFL